MTDISTSFTATGVGPSLLLLPQRTISYSLSGTFVATLVLERTNNGGQTWEPQLTTTTAVSAILYDPGTYRWRCSSFTSGTAVGVLDDLVDSIVFPVIHNQHGDVVLDVTDVGITTQAIQLAGSAWISVGATAPTNGTSGTGAGLTGPGSMFINTGGKAVYVNTNTILSPTWTQLDAGTGAVLAVTASAGLASSGGSSPNITISDAELLAIAGLVSAANKGIIFTGSGTAALYDLTAAALTVLSGATVAAMVDTLGGAASSGTGGLARVNSPTFVTPNIGNATGNISGNAGTATGLAAQAAHSFVANATAGSAAPTAISTTTAASELSDWNANVFKNFLANVIVDTSTARTLSATERGSVLTMNNASAITLTLHATAEIGYSVTVYQKGAGQISFAAASGATIRNRQSQTKAAGQYALCTLICEANAGSAAIWVLAGDTGT